MFTPEQLKLIDKIPPAQFTALLSDMIGAAKREMFKFIETQTGTKPPDDYMLTHKEEFSADWAAGEDHSIANVWRWKGIPVVKQRGTVTFDGVNMAANVRTEPFSNNP